MVRIAASVSLILSGCVAEDVYYHTQLLQTKMNSNKVSIDTAGNVDEETTLFQKAMRQTSSRKDAEARLLKRLSGSITGTDEETEEGCMIMYGRDCDMGRCFGCKEKVEGEIMKEMMENPDKMQEMQAMMEDPDGAEKAANAMIRKFAGMADDCMGKPNQLVSGCEEGYGPDVSLMKCIGCGEFCECSLEGCDKDCHASCMGAMEGPPEGPEGPEDGECDEMCKMFFGPEATKEQCKKCEGESMTAVETAMKGLDFSDPENMPKEEDFERIGMEAFKSSFDTCMAPLPNLVDQACKDGYGADVDLEACYMCGMKCGCDLEGCEFCEHSECMAEGEEEKKRDELNKPPREPKKPEGKPPREPKKPEGEPPRGSKKPEGKPPRGKKPEGKPPRMPKDANWGSKLVANVQKRAKMEVEKILGDATDLMQTRQHLKK